jgi:MFS family permease
MDHTGAVIGPVLAIITLLVLFLGFNLKDPLLALRWTFILAVIPGILAVLTIIFFVKEVSPGRSNSKLFRLSIGDFDKNFRVYLFIMIIFTLGNSSDAFLLFRVEEAIQKSGAVINFVHGIKPLHNLLLSFGTEENQAKVINILFLPLIWAFFHIIKVIFSTPLGALSDRIGRKIVINIGWAIYTFVYISFALLVFLPSNLQIIATFVLFAVYALFYAFSEGAEKAFVADLVKEEYRGTAFGLFNFAVGLGALPASIIFGFLYSYFDKLIPGFGGTVAFGFGGAIALISMILLAIMVKEPNRDK